MWTSQQGSLRACNVPSRIRLMTSYISVTYACYCGWRAQNKSTRTSTTLLLGILVQCLYRTSQPPVRVVTIGLPPRTPTTFVSPSPAGITEKLFESSKPTSSPRRMYSSTLYGGSPLRRYVNNPSLSCSLSKSTPGRSYSRVGSYTACHY